MNINVFNIFDEYVKEYFGCVMLCTSSIMQIEVFDELFNDRSLYRQNLHSRNNFQHLSDGAISVLTVIVVWHQCHTQLEPFWTYFLVPVDNSYS